MFRRYMFRTLVIAVGGLALALPACSAILDIDSLDDGKKDGLERDLEQPYDMAPVGHLFRAPGAKMALAAGQGELTFRWRDLPGRPSHVDLTLSGAAAKQPLVQVFSRDRRPYLRVGLRVLPLQAGSSYRLTYQQEQGRLQLELHGLPQVVRASVVKTSTLELRLGNAAFGGSRIELLGATAASTVRTAGAFAAAILPQ